jgi:ribose transport system substrate-binding protein
MNTMWTRTSAALLVTLAALGCGQSRSAPGTTTIAVIPKGTAHIFWQSIHAGAERAAKELGVEIIWRGPVREDDRDSQVSEVEGFVSRGVSGIVLAPLDETALMGPVSEAKARNIPVVIIDSGLKGTDFVSFVATDNLRGGELAAEEMARILGGKGTVLLLRYQENSASTQNREEGFIRSLAKFPGIRLIESDQYAGPTRDTGKRAAENLLNRYGRDLDGIFTVNETSTAGMLLALEDAGLAGKVTLIGFDATPAFEAALHAGTLHGLIVQNPFKMGQLGVSTMVDHLSKKRVEQRIDTGVVLVTRANLQQPDIAALIRPPV